MVYNIEKHLSSTSDSDFVFSIIIPTWNNLDYLKFCINSLKKNSHFKHQIIVVVNEGIDGTLKWLEEQNMYDFIHAKKNIGICYGLNIGRSLVKTKYIVYANDDMYFLPKWDLELKNEIDLIGHDNFMLSATMIEPYDTGNPCVIVNDFGTDINSFDEERLLEEQVDLKKNDWFGSTWPPNIVHVDIWDLVGGMSIEFSPGMYSDPDLSMKLWKLGVRYFKGVGNSRVYHFGSKSTSRVKRNKGKDTFLHKWGITSRFFVDKFLKRGQVFLGNLPEYNLTLNEKFINSIKKLLKSIN